MGKLSEIVKPWVDQENEQKKSDEERFVELLGILKLDAFPIILDSLERRYFYRDVRGLFDQYQIFLTRPDKFFGLKLGEQFEKFNTSFNELDSFLALNFSASDTNEDIYEVNKEKGDRSGQEEVVNRLIELRNKTKKDYIELVEIGKSPYIGRYALITSVVLMVFVIFSLVVYVFRFVVSFIQNISEI